MNLDDLKLGREALDAVAGLAMKVELLGQRRYRATRSLDDLVELLKVSQLADVDDIRQSFERFMGFLSSDQHTFFRVLGIEAQPRSATSKSYRGQQVASPQKTDSAASGEVNREGKRKVIYRGRETWVDR